MSPSPTRSWRTPIVVVVAGCIISLLAFGIRAMFGLYLAPMSTDLGWGREVFAIALALQNLIWGLGAPFAGAIADRFGPAKVIASGGALYAVGVYVMSGVTTPAVLHLSAGLLVGLALAGAAQGIVLAAITRSVPEHRRSMALGIGTAAGSLGQFTLVPVGQAFLEAYGWSTALGLVALFGLAIIPLSSALAGEPGKAQSTVAHDQTIAQALREASRHSGYIYLTLGFFVCGFHVAFIAVHLPAYVTDLGLPAKVGAWSLSLVGLFNIIGAYTSGVLGGQASKKGLLSGLYFGRAVVIALFISLPPSEVTVLLFSCAMGLLWLSTVPLTSGLVAQMFGVRYMATLFGIVFLSHQVGSFLGVWLGGYLFDRTGSYDLVWWIGIGLGLFSAAIHLPIDERPVARLAMAAR